MRCLGVTCCVPPHEICDGISHCPRQEDEKYCQTCPQGCKCKGTAIYCNNVSTLSLSAELYSPLALILYNSYPLYLTFYQQYFDKMQYVHLVDVKHGSFVSLLDTNLQISQKFLSVKVLYLNYQGLHTLYPYFINGPSITYLNLSNNVIWSVQRNAFSYLHNVKINS